MVASLHNVQRRGRAHSLSHVLEKFDYEGKDEEVVGTPDSKIIGPPALLSERTTAQAFTTL